MLNNSQLAHRHNNRIQHQVAVPKRRQPGVSTANFNKLQVTSVIKYCNGLKNTDDLRKAHRNCAPAWKRLRPAKHSKTPGNSRNKSFFFNNYHSYVGN